MSAAVNVNEVFETIQGEGSNAGCPAVFIRLQGCPVGCPWCDTPHTWAIDPKYQATADVTLSKTASSAAWAPMSTSMLLAAVRHYTARLVVITGGEPALYDLRALSRALIDEAACRVQVETSGTHDLQVDPRAWVTVAPKIKMPGGYGLSQATLARADEIKMPVGKPADVNALLDLLESGAVNPSARIYVAPLSLSKKATELCVNSAITYGWRVSLQVHALAGWR